MTADCARAGGEGPTDSGRRVPRAWRWSGVLGAAHRCARLRGLARRQERAWSRLMQQLERRRCMARRLQDRASAGSGTAGSPALVSLGVALDALETPLDCRECARREWELELALDALLGELRSSGALPADAGLRRLQYDLVEIEDHIHYLRRYHNGIVHELQAGLAAASAHCLARLLGLKPHPPFQPEASLERQIARAARRLGDG